MTWKELERKARDHGFRFVKHGEKHDIYENPETGKRVLIERNWSQEVRPGLMKFLKRISAFKPISYPQTIQIVSYGCKN